MRARPLAIAAFLAVGVVLNMLVSVSAIVFSSEDDWRIRSSDEWVGDPPSPRDIDLLATRDERVKAGTVVERHGNTAWSLSAIAIDYSASAFWMKLDGILQDGAPIGGILWPMAVRVRAGWPLSSFEGTCWVSNGRAKESAFQHSEREHLLTIGPGGPLQLKGARDIPIAPLWLGLTVNSILLGALAAVPVQLGQFLVRWRRVQAGRCLRCNYPATPLASGTCPECGTVAPTSGFYSVQLPPFGPRLATLARNWLRSPMLVRLRWPMAVLAIAAASVALLSIWVFVAFEVPLGSHGPWMGAAFYPGTLRFGWDEYGDPAASFELIQSQRIDWSEWSQRGSLYAKSEIPLWLLVLPPAAIAAAGFSARRRQPNLARRAA